jgi:heparosan-N-sulfate-glucuronate 5-epimerase
MSRARVGPTGRSVRLRPNRLQEFLSVSFNQPIGPRIRTDGLGGYYIDMRVKATSPRWPATDDLPPDAEGFHVAVAQWGLAAYEHWLATGSEKWLAAATAVCDHFLATQCRSGPQAGGWVHDFRYPHTFPLEPPWICAMVQGQAASLLVRMHAETGRDAFAEAAIRALHPLQKPSVDGGAQALLAGGPFFEEYPTSPASLVLNGGIYALWGVHNVAVALEDAEARALFDAGLDVLAACIDRWDLGYWTRYDLYPHRRVNVASPAYHELHIDQLAAMNTLVPRPALREAEMRWRGYLERPSARARAFAGKVAFRISVPRTRMAKPANPSG